MRRGGFLAWLVLAAAAPALAREPRSRAATPAPQSGVVIKVVDGDSLRFKPDEGAAIEVRLRDIDAPEICQDWGAEARRALEEFALGKSVTLAVSGHDRYGRAVARVRVAGEDLGRRMVAEGHAWSERTRWDRGPLMKEERLAVALKRGLHGTGTPPVPPRQFRKTHGPCERR